VIDDNDEQEEVEEEEEEEEVEVEEEEKKKKKKNMLWPAIFEPRCRKKVLPSYSHCPDEVSSRFLQIAVRPTEPRSSHFEDCSDTGT
jgi:peroxiredoxin